MLKVIFFDAAGTLIHLPESVGSHYRQVGLRHGIDFPAAAFDRAFQTVWKAMPVRPSTQTARPGDDREWWRELVYGVLNDVGAQDSTRPAREPYFADLYEHFRDPQVWAVYPEAPAVLETLARVFRLGVVSNFDGRLRTILEGHGLLRYFSDLVLSSEAGADKPDSAIFQSALGRMGVEPSEALHVGDDPLLDWATAEAVGIAAFRLNRPENSLLDLLAEVDPGA